MCGIAGRFTPAAGKPDESLVRSMCGALAHRGPDDDGFYTDPWLQAGMRRLSIIDVAGGHQPLFNEDGSIVVVFNGEIYNFIELRRELEVRGHRFKTHSDGEIIVHLFEEQGIRCLDALNGMFAFCIWDSRRREGYLVRDRIGIKPLYYTTVDSALLFASELKAIAALPRVSTELDEQALLEYLHYLCIPAPRTPFKGICKLPPACYMRLTADGIGAPTSYWEYPVDEMPARSESALRDEFFALMESAVELQLRSDVPVGVFLSGGIDSSLITALATRRTGQSVLAFSVAYPGNPFDEAPFARLAADRFGSELHTVSVGPSDVRAMLPRAVWHMDEPHADSAAIATLAVSDLAARHVKVVLSGTGGDELFAGYSWHLPATPALRALQALPAPVVGALSGALRLVGLPDETARAMRWVRNGETTFAWPHYQFKPGELDGFFGDRRTDSATQVFLQQLRMLRGHGLNRLLEMDARFYLTDDLLLLLDKMTMASSIEGRVPLLDHRLVEWAFRIPGNLKMKGRTRKALLKSWLRGMLPDELLTRPKWGFGAPVQFWMSGELDTLCRSMLQTRPASRAHFAWGLTGAALDVRLQSLSAQKRYALLVLELWCRLYLDRADRALPLRELAA